MKPPIAEFQSFTLSFIKPMGTSRGVLSDRRTYILTLREPDGARAGLGECAPLPGLSPDDRPDFEKKLQEVCDAVTRGAQPADLDLSAWPAIRFGLEAAWLDRRHGGRRRYFDTAFVHGQRSIPINGLVTMADRPTMLEQAVQKIDAGFDCIKIKVGALDFEEEVALLAELRERFPADRIQLRLDANGAFSPEEALERLCRLAAFGVHSLEQPIRPRQWEALAKLCRDSPIPIALDEELIGLTDRETQAELLRSVKPRYIILKPTLLGGLTAAQQWIALAEQVGIGWWLTSALESNIGLDILAQWASSLNLRGHQGLGTGRLFVANFPAQLMVRHGHLAYRPEFSPAGHSLADLRLIEAE